ncbi:MAG: hypothetical protein HYW37_00935 [Candidatus Colwellbacteria bacterium]|nr:hypothetical protein [Candidatus Colwellbacteria bacterium]
MVKKITIFIFIFLSAVIAITLMANVFSPKVAQGKYDGFAECLSNSGAVMYGAYWCPHCQNEKAAFGDSFRFVNYVECTEEPKRCLANKVESYPSWLFPDGRRLAGEQGLEKLSEESGCPLQP